MITTLKLYEIGERYVLTADVMIKEAYETKIKPEYEEVDLLRGRLLMLSELVSDAFISKKIKEKADELASMVIDL